MADPISSIQVFGYTEREAAFLYLVAAHSGYFLRRQFDYFIDRNKGAIVHGFLEKARATRHVTALEGDHGWRIYHLSARPIYRILGEPESQNRRRKGDAAIKARLMSLDYVLAHPDHHFIASSSEKIRYFVEVRGIAASSIFEGTGCLPLSLTSAACSLVDRSTPSSSRVTLAFVDEGLLTLRKFDRFLDEAESLLLALRMFEIVYVSDSNRHFAGATAKFRRRFAPLVSEQQRLLRPDWRESHQQPAEICRRIDPSFSTLLLGYSYPQLLRSADGVLRGVRMRNAVGRESGYIE